MDTSLVVEGQDSDQEAVEDKRSMDFDVGTDTEGGRRVTGHSMAD